MSVIQDALRRKLDEQRAVTDAAPAAPTKAPPQTPPLAQQVLQQGRVEPARPRVASGAPEAVESAYVRGRPVAGRRDDQFTIWLLVTAILVMLTAAFVGALVFFLNAQHVRLTATTIQPAASTQPETPPAAKPPAGGVTGPVLAPPAVAAPDPGWPDIQVGGVLTGGARSKASALLNGRMVKLGQYVNGVRLVSLTEEGVTLDFQGERRFVETGQSTGSSVMRP